MKENVNIILNFKFFCFYKKKVFLIAFKTINCKINKKIINKNENKIYKNFYNLHNF